MGAACAMHGAWADGEERAAVLAESPSSLTAPSQGAGEQEDWRAGHGQLHACSTAAEAWLTATRSSALPCCLQRRGGVPRDGQPGAHWLVGLKEGLPRPAWQP